MKKAMMIGVAALIFLLTGCGQNNTKSAASSSSQQTATTVIAKSMKAAKTIKNSDINLTTTVNMGDTDTKANMTGSYQIDPFIMSMDYVTKSANGDANIKMYVDDSTAYVQDQDAWYRMDISQVTGASAAELRKQTESSSFLDSAKSLQKKMKLTTHAATYALSYQGSGKAIKDIAKDIMAQSPGASASLEKVWSAIDITKFEMTMTMDKKTYLPKQYHYTMTAKIDDQKMTQTVDATYSRINQLKPLTIPDNVKKNAQALSSSSASDSTASTNDAE
ncbi:DUF6612 family protein [Schleiferilactobacillus perolens]|uniref:Lipoprotein n=1 Tax=Schleiferilactobacillus perolens DSM 12744 TaxID=1423792 RepID=A0A0R1MVU4_9LACO|nr:DUF6612 family protein [Schleiferilactobacillus perolens]KRL12382.1 hypothetical protein FD09_GL002963 [Schleiferilactobacillus perolens DSM 12744]